MECVVELSRVDLKRPMPDAERAMLDGEEAARLAGMRVPAAARRFAATRVALRRALAARLGRSPRDVVLRQGAHGKPSAEDAAGWYFNVSHADDLAIIAFTRDGQVGVDLEAQSRFADNRRLRPLVCSPAERAWLEAHPGDSESAFGRLWVRKEALLKALGTGLSTSPTGIDLACTLDETFGMVQLVDPATGSHHAALWRDVAIDVRHVGAVALLAPPGACALRVMIEAVDDATDPAASASCVGGIEANAVSKMGAKGIQ